MLSRKILFFISVAENGSFSSAAKKFYLSQSAVSQQIDLLETELGVKLFDRSKYRPVLTEAGKFYYKECKKLYEQYELLVKDVQNIGNKSQNTLRIGITGPMEKRHLPYILNIYKKKYKEIQIDVKKINFQSGISLLEEKKLDVAFGITNDFRDKGEIEVVNLLKHKVCVICSTEHPWAERKSVDGAEIANEPIISFSKKMGNNFYFDFIEAFKKDGVTPHIVQEVDGLEELLLAVRFNQGIGLTSREVVSEEDGVWVLDIDNTHHHADFCMGYLAGNNKPFVQDFVEATKEYYRQITL
ncbi:LysR family transcriptional regulator [Konateibacter massiliensis]|uniref:LysR family transcriptional regulator n=1 Tax=Konateibacter massiliensis TaxID=2002841 RepID=UPI000C161169|nr:LysR family transcriptional regulator [Konateibacter massiliensis]